MVLNVWGGKNKEGDAGYLTLFLMTQLHWGACYCYCLGGTYGHLLGNVYYFTLFSIFLSFVMSGSFSLLGTCHLMNTLMGFSSTWQRYGHGPEDQLIGVLRLRVRGQGYCHITIKAAAAAKNSHVLWAIFQRKVFMIKEWTLDRICVGGDMTGRWRASINN